MLKIVVLIIILVFIYKIFFKPKSFDESPNTLIKCKTCGVYSEETINQKCKECRNDNNRS
ncbi:MAG: Unknown protein [uncultured Campylobacterales bacterium]|uniref:Uncharacterized protein n=1 Tax=uncultured Campylobacterales bacterium TaxID=352960 RepID=A0A6S6SF98_9BACT|nr:MAG: Unknown protein [uncultured Campylobacterales bacterium]